MYYKIVSKNSNLINKASNIFTSMGMKESIHIQEVNFWLVDSNTIDKKSLQSYINKKSYNFVLFVVFNDEHIKLCLENNFTSYIKSNFSKTELVSWCKHFISKQKDLNVKLDEESTLNFNSHQYIDKNNTINLTIQEIALLNAINKKDFVSTINLMNILNVSSQNTVRSIVNRIRKKIKSEIILHKRQYGYKLNITIEKESKKTNDLHIKELEEQNSLMQRIIDSSPIFIVTFVHKQLYCINESFREYLGKDIIKELWNETKGDFFQLIKHKQEEKELLKKNLFVIGVHQVELLNFKSEKITKFNIKTYYFRNLDKHLLIFENI